MLLDVQTGSRATAVQLLLTENLNSVVAESNWLAYRKMAVSKAAGLTKPTGISSLASLLLSLSHGVSGSRICRIGLVHSLILSMLAMVSFAHFLHSVAEALLLPRLAQELCALC